MAAAVGLSSPFHRSCPLSALEDLGLIEARRDKAARLEVFNSDGSSVKLDEVKEVTTRGTVSLPLVGRVAAGLPILAEQKRRGHLHPSHGDRDRFVLLHP